MLQAYQGYFQEEIHFNVNNRAVMIPTNRRVIINILDDETEEEPRNGEVYQFSAKRKHIPLKERLDGFVGEYEFEEWDTGANVGIEVIK